MMERPRILLLEKNARAGLAVRDEESLPGYLGLFVIGDREAAVMTDGGVPLHQLPGGGVVHVLSPGNPDLPPMFDIHQSAADPQQFNLNFVCLGTLGSVSAAHAERIARIPTATLPEGMMADWGAARATAAETLEAEAQALQERADALDSRATNLREQGVTSPGM